MYLSKTTLLSILVALQSTCTSAAPFELETRDDAVYGSRQSPIPVEINCDKYPQICEVHCLIYLCFGGSKMAQYDKKGNDDRRSKSGYSQVFKKDKLAANQVTVPEKNSASDPDNDSAEESMRASWMQGGKGCPMVAVGTNQNTAEGTQYSLAFTTNDNSRPKLKDGSTSKIVNDQEYIYEKFTNVLQSRSNVWKYCSQYLADKPDKSICSTNSDAKDIINHVYYYDGSKYQKMAPSDTAWEKASGKTRLTLPDCADKNKGSIGTRGSKKRSPEVVAAAACPGKPSASSSVVSTIQSTAASTGQSTLASTGHSTGVTSAVSTHASTAKSTGVTSAASTHASTGKSAPVATGKSTPVATGKSTPTTSASSPAKTCGKNRNLKC